MFTTADKPVFSLEKLNFKRDNLQSICPRFLFHFSPKTHRHSIEKEGLLKDPPSGRFWDLQEAAVFCYSSPIQAWLWLLYMSYDASSADIWMVDSKNLDMSVDSWASSAIRIETDVPVDSIVRLPKYMLGYLSADIPKIQGALFNSCCREYDLELFEKIERYFVNFFRENIIV